MSTENQRNRGGETQTQKSSVDTRSTEQNYSEVSGQILADIESFVTPEPDGVPGYESNVWTCKRRIESHSQKNTVSYNNSDVEQAVNALIDAEDVIEWFGLLAPATDEHLCAIIENELLTDTPRKILIAQCNRLRQTGGE